MLMADVVQVVVVGILGHPSVEVRPGQDIHCVLLGLNRLDGDLSHEVVVKHVCPQV